MKIFSIFAVILAVASAYEPISTWTINELSDAIENPATDPAVLPYLKKALNQLIDYIYSGKPKISIIVSIPVTITYTINELDDLLRNPETNPALKPYLEAGLETLVSGLLSGQNSESVKVHIPAMNVSRWSLQEISHALRRPIAQPELQVYLEYALDHLMQAIYDGQFDLTIDVVTPPGLNAIPPVIPDSELYISPEAEDLSN